MKESLNPRALVTAVAVSAAGVLPVFLTGSLIVQLNRDLGVTDTRLGIATAIFFSASAATSSTAGRLIERRLGSGTGLRIAAALSALAMGVVAAWAVSFWQLCAGLAVAGVGNACAQPGANVLLASAIPPERLGFAFAVKQSAVPVAILFGGLSVPALALTVGWRWVFAGGTMLALMALASVPSLRTAGGHPLGKRPRARPPSYLTLGILVVGCGLGAASVTGLATFLVASAVAGGISDGNAGILLAVGSVVGILSRLVVGALADRRWREPLGVVAAMFAVGTVGYLLLALGSVVPAVIGTLVGFAAGWGWPGLFHYSVVRAHPRIPGVATSITQTGIYVGAIVGPLVFGFMAQSVGYGPAWLFSAGTATLAAAAMVIANRRVSEREAAQADGRWSEILRAGTPAQNS